MEDLELQIKDGAVRFRVRVKPRSSRSRVLQVRAGVLEVAVTAAPVEGQANAELLRALAGHFAVPKSAVAIVSGAAGRTKLVSLAGVTATDVAARLPR
jgi:uncharacterized protein